MNHTTKTFARMASVSAADYSNWLETPQRKPLAQRVLAWTYAVAALVLVYVVLIEGAPK